MKRAVVLTALVTLGLLLLAHPDSNAANLGSDPYANLSGGSGHGGLVDRYPLSRYALDTHIDSGTLPDASWGEEAAGFVTSILWTVTAWITKTVIGLVVMAFSLDLLSAGGALTPIARAIRSINDHVLGEPWMVAAIAFAGLWALWKGIVQRRHSEAASSLGMSVAFVLIAMFLVFKPIETVGQVASWTNDVSEGFLVGTNTGSIAHPEQAKQRIADELFRTQVLAPWAVLNFGGLKHCVDGSKRDGDGYPRPVAPDDPARTACRNHLKVVNGAGGYAPRFLAQPPGSKGRMREYQALRDGKIPEGSGPDGDLSGDIGISAPLDPHQFDGYHVDKSDSPAVDIQQKGSAYNRLVLALVILLTSLAFVVLFGLLALAIILAQIAALLILAFSPVVLLAAVIPGKGHQVFVAWGGKLLTALVIKAFYSLVVAVLIAVSAALTSATGTLGWLYAFGLLGAFYGMVFVKRKWMASQLVSKREYTKSERSVEKTAAAGAGMVAAPFVTLAGLAASKAKQESGLGSQAPSTAPQASQDGQRHDYPREHTSGSVEHQEPRTVESASSESHGGVGKPGAVVPRDAVEPTSAQSRPPAVPPSPEVAAAQERVSESGEYPLTNQRTVESVSNEGPLGASRERPRAEVPSASSRPSVPHVEGLPALPVEQERAPKGEDLAPPPEYRGP